MNRIASRMRSRPTRATFALLALFGAACVPLEDADPAPSGPPIPGIKCEWAHVRSVTDGDTIRVDFEHGPRNVPVRYIGVDTPEKAGSPEGAQPFGEEATARNRELVDDEDICLERDTSDTDRFDRLLRYAWLDDGRLVNEVLVAEGLADAVRFPPDTSRSGQLEAAESRARANRLGIWRD